MMKKIFLVLFILLMSFGYGKNFNEYESKRLFDKLMESLLTGDFDKYLNDPKMYKILEYDKEECVERNKIYFGNVELYEEFQYEVINVDENNDKSEIELKITHKIVKDLPQKLEKELAKAYEQIMLEKKILSVEVNFFEAYAITRKKLNYEIQEEELKVYMERNNGIWEVVENEKNEKFKESLSVGYMEFLKLLEN